jgi:hypothetical protein
MRANHHASYLGERGQQGGCLRSSKASRPRRCVASHAPDAREHARGFEPCICFSVAGAHRTQVLAVAAKHIIHATGTVARKRLERQCGAVTITPVAPLGDGEHSWWCCSASAAYALTTHRCVLTVCLLRSRTGSWGWDKLGFSHSAPCSLSTVTCTCLHHNMYRRLDVVSARSGLERRREIDGRSSPR